MAPAVPVVAHLAPVRAWRPRVSTDPSCTTRRRRRAAQRPRCIRRAVAEVLHAPLPGSSSHHAVRSKRGGSVRRKLTSKLSSARLRPSPRALMNASLRVQQVRNARGCASGGRERSTPTSAGEKNRSAMRSVAKSASSSSTSIPISPALLNAYSANRPGVREVEPRSRASAGLSNSPYSNSRLLGRGPKVAAEQPAQQRTADDIARTVALEPEPVRATLLVSGKQPAHPLNDPRGTLERGAPDVNLTHGQRPSDARILEHRRLSGRLIPVGGQDHTGIVKAYATLHVKTSPAARHSIQPWQAPPSSRARREGWAAQRRSLCCSRASRRAH